jgi:hypothetical protein
MEPDSKLVCVKEFAHTSAIEGGSDEEILEPVVVIGKVIEVSKFDFGQMKNTHLLIPSEWIVIVATDSKN